jgi:hypothetical protein
VGDCAALGWAEGAGPIAAFLTTGAWSTAEGLPSPAAPGEEFSSNSFSCTAARTCVVGGTYSEGPVERPAVISFASGTWGPVTPIGLPADVATSNTHSAVEAVSCVDGDTCTAVGNYMADSGFEEAFSTRLVAGIWQPAVQVPVAVADEPEFPEAVGWHELDCVSADSCGAIGYGFFHGTVALMEGGSWGSGASPVLYPPRTQSQEAGDLRSMSCGGAGACAAVGSYVDDEGMERALVLSTEGYSSSGGGETGGGGEHDSGTGTSTGGGGGNGTSGGAAPRTQGVGPGSQARMGGGTAKVKNGKALIALQCPAAGNCSGTLQLTVTGGAAFCRAVMSATCVESGREEE